MAAIPTPHQLRFSREFPNFPDTSIAQFYCPLRIFWRGGQYIESPEIHHPFDIINEIDFCPTDRTLGTTALKYERFFPNVCLSANPQILCTNLAELLFVTGKGSSPLGHLFHILQRHTEYEDVDLISFLSDPRKWAGPCEQVVIGSRDAYRILHVGSWMIDQALHLARSDSQLEGDAFTSQPHVVVHDEIRSDSIGNRSDFADDEFSNGFDAGTEAQSATSFRQEDTYARSFADRRTNMSVSGSWTASSTTGGPDDTSESSDQSNNVGGTTYPGPTLKEVSDIMRFIEANMTLHAAERVTLLHVWAWMMEELQGVDGNEGGEVRPSTTFREQTATATNAMPAVPDGFSGPTQDEVDRVMRFAEARLGLDITQKATLLRVWANALSFVMPLMDGEEQADPGFVAPDRAQEDSLGSPNGNFAQHETVEGPLLKEILACADVESLTGREQ
ncbi:hypothetical protein MBLNU230_g4784t1 [Neophaeotheca triangularis]